MGYIALSWLCSLFHSVLLLLLLSLQFLRCVAPNISYHAPTSKRMIRGVAVRLPQLLDYLDKHGVNHKSAKVIRKKAKKSKKCAPRMKQYFLKNGVVLKDARVQREQSVCKGCLCIPDDDDFLLFFSCG